MDLRNARRILFFVLLSAAAVPGQQYTGVKSVSSSDASNGVEKTPTADHGAGRTGGSTGISARSIDRFTNEVPASDSKIIKLSIKKVEPRVISGSRGARNLGSTDASLNAIPGGLNNELTNLDLNSPQSLPTSVAKDSYGNPVTPYTDLASTGLESVGFLTDVNRDALQSTKSNQVGSLNFKVPSYASGIIQPISLPSTNLNNGLPVQNRHNPHDVTTQTPSSTPFQFVPNAKFPTIDDGKILFAQTPLNGLLPPLFPGEQVPTYNVEVGTERSPIFVKDPFSGSKIDTGLRLPQENPPIDFNQGAQKPFPSSAGPAQTPQIIQAPPQQTPSQHTPPQQTPQIFHSPPNPQIPSQPTKAPTQKYTGGFGGAPGFLGNQQNLGTAYKPTTPIPSIPQKPVSFQPPPPPSTPQLPTVINPPAPFQPPPPQQAFPQRPQPTKAPGSTYTGDFGFANNSPRPQQPPQPTAQSFPQQPAPTKAPGGFGFNTNNNPQQAQPRPTTQRPGQYVGNKFSGSFGGAPGLLGNQKQPGTHVKPDGTILPPSAPGVAASGSPVAGAPEPAGGSQSVSSSGSSFSGTFGGPPGILRPFDNVKG
ncbi:proline-rich protein 36-like [Topomyia yanbarensis]|uniref:proline-rich protein 36-like n=1 Tax=Topomyia yanbarensis TaxID=2498891 RepID=UPI00273CF273|nr:proline-rich protein 36-like [Topomyia yanbarensis]